MDKRLLRSFASLAVVLALGIGATYADFTSNTVTISGNSLGTGSADVKICNATAVSGWTEEITPNLSLGGMVPGDTDKVLNPTTTIQLGNDNGALNIDGCTTGSDGTSTTPLRMLPTLSDVDCGGIDVLKDQFELRFKFGSTAPTPYRTLTEWTTNTLTTGSPTFQPGDIHQLEIQAKLVSAATEQGRTCTFKTHFTGVQP